MIDIFLHKNLRDTKHKQYRNIKIYFWCVIVLIAFLIPYCIYFAVYYPNDTVKIWNNYICVSLFAFSLVLLRFAPSFKFTLVYGAILSYIPIMISVYHTGGLYSADLAWVFVCLVTQSLIIEYWWGSVATLLIVSFLVYLYIYENQLDSAHNIFKNYLLTHNNTHYFFTWTFVVILLAVVVGTFGRVLSNTNKKLEALSNQKINELEILIKQKTEEMSEFRGKLARDFHDEMGNRLASINILSQSILVTLAQQENSASIKMLDSISRHSKELFDGTKDFIWSIDFKSDYLFELYIYLREFGEQYFSDIEVSFVSSCILSDQSLYHFPATTGRHIILMCKEIMTNAAKHASCTEVTFEIGIRNNMAYIFLSDNGVGFNIKEVPSRGISNIKKRTNEINGLHELRSSPQGTVHEFYIPLQKHSF